MEMDIPTYLLSTAYGQRLLWGAQKSDADGKGDDHFSSSGLAGSSTNGTPPQKRIYNKTTASASNGAISPTLSMRSSARAHYGLGSSTPTTPSTLPIFRDDLRQTNNSDDEMDSSVITPAATAQPGSDNNVLLPLQEALPELPKRWVKRDVDQQVSITKEGKLIEHHSDGKPNIQEARAIKSDCPVPGLCGVWYYEVEILSCSRDLMLSVGFCTAAAHLKKMPGLESNTWGYHSDDGKAVACQTPGSEYGPVFGCGDIIGCGLDFTMGTIFFTKNGIALGDAFENLEMKDSKTLGEIEYYPCMGFKPSVRLKTNFGDEEFIYDINQYVQDKKQRLIESITKDDQVLPTIDGQQLTNEDVPELIQDLIGSYFSYLGYVDTAKAFQAEVKTENAARVGEIVAEDTKMEGEDEPASSQDIEVLNRQRIGRVICDGDIDRAFKYLKLFYPQVLEEKDSLVVFKLECCKFIELIRATIPNNSVQDVVMTDDGGDSSIPFDRESELNIAVAYGQGLRDRYKDDPRPYVVNRLKLVFSLVAYSDPREDESVAFLLGESERYALAEEVNSRILVSLGKAPIPPLQRVAQHSMGLIWELQNSGRLDTNLLNIQQDFF